MRVQLATFSFQALQASTSVTTVNSNNGTSTASDQAGGGGYISTSLLPVMFLNAATLLQNNIHRVYWICAITVVAALLVVFVIQFLRELRTFAKLKQAGRSEEANQVFFHSFVGSIVYGHGELHGVSSFVSGLVELLADTLFLIVCTKLLSILTCNDDDVIPTLRINPEIQCWEGEHRIMAVTSWIALGFYLPLATMIAPMLVEAEDPKKNQQKKKDVTYIKPFLSAIVVSKCILLIVTSYFGHDNAYVTVITQLIISCGLFAFMTAWIQRSALAKTQGIIGLAAGEMILLPPCQPAAVNVWRSLSFLGGGAGSIIALLAHAYPSNLDGDRKFAVLLGAMLVLAIVGLIWYRWRLAPKKIEKKGHPPAVELASVAITEPADKRIASRRSLLVTDARSDDVVITAQTSPSTTTSSSLPVETPAAAAVPHGVPTSMPPATESSHTHATVIVPASVDVPVDAVRAVRRGTISRSSNGQWQYQPT